MFCLPQNWEEHIHELKRNPKNPLVARDGSQAVLGFISPGPGEVELVLGHYLVCLTVALISDMDKKLSELLSPLPLAVGRLTVQWQPCGVGPLHLGCSGPCIIPWFPSPSLQPLLLTFPSVAG
jgi:hypothetical protein